MTYETVWTFNTARFTVELSVVDEIDSPAGHFEFPEDIEFAQEGGWHWFQARVRVLFRDDDNPKNWATPRTRLLGEDYLGGCSYHSLEDFKVSGYFRDMVSEAVREARGTLARMSATDVRAP